MKVIKVTPIQQPLCIAPRGCKNVATNLVTVSPSQYVTKTYRLCDECTQRAKDAST